MTFYAESGVDGFRRREAARSSTPAASLGPPEAPAQPVVGCGSCV